jgi:succinate-semialdehyde dehydrogenase/glutarate-semialdehyde dehydrogenase
LKDPSLFIEKSYINGEWVGAQSGETFEVHGKKRVGGIYTS